MNTPEAAANFQNDEKKVDISVSLNIKATEINHENSEFSRGGNKWFFLGNLILKIIFYIVSLSSSTTVFVVVVNNNNNNYYSAIEWLIISVSLVILIVTFISILCSIKNSENRNEQPNKTVTDIQESQPAEDSSGNEGKGCCVSKFKKWICKKGEKRSKKRKSIFRRRRK